MEFDEIVVKESPGLCRCCLSEGCYKDMGTEYAWMNENEVYADMLLECFDISISQHNEGPNGPNRLICEVCITRLRDACYFKKQVLDTEKKFVDMLGRGEFAPKAVLLYQPQFKAESSEVEVSVEADVEYLEDDMDYVDDDTLKAEDDEPIATVSADPLPVRGKRGRPRKGTTKPAKKVKVEAKAKSSKALVKDENEPTNGHKANRIMRKNLQILLNNSTVIPFKWRGRYMCFYCGKQIDEYSQLTQHTKAHGSCTEKDRAIRLVKGQNAEIKFDVSEDINCLLCHESFSDIDTITDHFSYEHKLTYDKRREFSMTAYRLVDLKCLLCPETLENLSRLIKHCNRYHRTNCFICHDCGQSFNKKRDLRSHIHYYHRHEYVCKQCNLKFKDKAAFFKHNMRPHHVICDICFERFSSSKKRLVHMREHYKNEDFKCGYCDKKFDTKIAVMNHFAHCKVKLKHRSKLYKESAYLDTSNRKQVSAHIKDNLICIVNSSTLLPFKYFLGTFKCFFCKSNYVDSDDLKKHVKAEHPSCSEDNLKWVRLYEGYHFKVDISSLSCKLCVKPMQDIEALSTHLITEHKIDYDKTFNAKLQPFKLISNKFPCLSCSKTFEIFGDLLKHKSVIHSKNITVCMYCGKPFKAITSLRVHISLKHNPDGYKCEICSMEFSTGHLLRGHMGKVHGKKKAKCQICSEKFTSPYIMKTHMMEVHEKGFTCDHCGKMFTSKCFMLEHVRRTHLKEKNAECSICFERFFDHRLLKMHMVKHIGERKFGCDICGKTFLWKKNLRAHMNSHKKV